MSQYFIRSRGRVQGPFNLDSLKQLARKGKVSRFDQVSVDREQWESAGDIEEIFPQPPTAQERAGPTAAPSATQGPRFFYSKDGLQNGPFDLATLQQLAASGIINPADPVWAENATVASLARDVPMLATFFGERSAGGFGANAPRKISHEVTQRIQRNATILYIVFASIVLAFTMSPVAFFEGKTFWWWDAARASGGSLLMAVSIFYCLASISALIVAPLTRGGARPTTMLILSSAALLLGLVAVLGTNRGAGSDQVISTLCAFALPSTLGILVSINQFRIADDFGGTGAGRLPQVIVGSVTIIPPLAALILMMTSRGITTDAPGSVVFAVVLQVLAMFAAMGAGVLAVIAAKPTFTRGINLASTICAISAAALGTIALLTLLISLHDIFRGFQDAGDAFVWVVIRFVVIFVGLLIWNCSAVRELLAWIHRKTALSQG